MGGIFIKFCTTEVTTKTIIAGSRTITSYEIVQKAILLAHGAGVEITEVVSGKARGIDTLGEEWAKANNVPVAEFPVKPADWKRYGKRAGYLRNQQMGKYAEALIAIWDGKSRGTGHMIDIADNLGLFVKVFAVDETTKELKEMPSSGSQLHSSRPGM